MTTPTPALVGIVVRKDGTVPFDEGCHPDVRAHILRHLADTGHTIAPVADTQHVKISNGPLAPKG